MHRLIQLPVLNISSGVGPGDALVSANVILRGGLFADGARRDLHLFMDLCSLLEAAVLHERLFCLPTAVPSGTELLPVVQALVSEGILWKLESGTPDFQQRISLSVMDYLSEVTPSEARSLLGYVTGDDTNSHLPKIRRAFEELQIGVHCGHAYPLIGLDHKLDGKDLLYRFMRAISYLSAANSLNVSYLPNFNRLAIVQPILRASVNRIRLDFLARANEQIKAVVEAQEERLRLAGREINLSLPPLVSVILARARNSGSLESAVLVTRAEFEPVRERFAKYARLVASDEIPMAESLYALDKLETDLRTITDSAKEGTSLRMLEWRPLATFLAGAVDNPESLESAKSWTELTLKLLKMPLAALSSYIRRRRVQPLLDLPQKVATIESLSSLTEDTLSWRPTPADLFGLRRFVDLVAEPIDQADASRASGDG